MTRLYVGTYAEGGGAGLYPLHPDGAGGWNVGEPFGGAPNASFGAYSPRFDLHYLVDESAGLVRALRHDDAGWRVLSAVETHGADPCYVSLSVDEGWLAVANYASGSLAVFRVDPDTGLIGDADAVLPNQGHGPNPDRQAGPHAHCAVFSPDGKWLFQTDLGTDQLQAFPFDCERGVVGEANVAFAALPGSGPRHLLFHPSRPIAMLVSELASTLTLFDMQESRLLLRQTVSTLPAGFDGESLGGHLAIDRTSTRIYVTNRGHDSIAAFALDDAGLTLIGHTSAGGASPRFFLLTNERQLILANEESGSVTIFDIADNGMPVPSGEVALPGAAFIFEA